MKRFLLAVFITMIISFGVFGYFHVDDRSQEIIDPDVQNSYREF